MQHAPADWQASIDAVWHDDRLSSEQTLARIAELVAELPSDDPRGPFELGGAHDSAGHEAEAAVAYERAIELGLSGRARAELDIQYASTLRNLGRVAESIALLDGPGDDPELAPARAAFLALALHDGGRPGEALAVALDALAPTLPQYQRSVRGYAAELRAGADTAAPADTPAAAAD